MKSYWALRVGAAGCFIGHGAFGFITKAAWLPYFAVVGIPESWAWKIMPMVGAIDVLAGMAILFAPSRLPLIYMSVWALWTALLRPLAGESVFEMVERAGNYGVPFALLLWVGLPRSWRDLVTSLPAGAKSAASELTMTRVLQWTAVLLLAGHGALGVTGKAMLTNQYAFIGLPEITTPMVGWFELAVAGLVAIRPSATLLAFVALWKLGTEALFPLSGAPIWEFVERFGSYTAPAALAVMLVAKSADRASINTLELRSNR